MKYLLDSGMGDELEQRGFEVPDWKTSIWSVSALIKSPNAVVEIHKDNIKAGCNVITTNNYYVTPNILKREGIESEFESLTRLAIDLAEESRQGFPEVLIAGSFPPIETNFRPDLTPSNDVLDDYYSNLGSFIQQNVDLIICETMGSIREGINAARNALEFSDHVWLSWTNKGVSGDALPSGEKLKDAITEANQLDIECQLVNCCAADLATKNIEILKTATNFGIYANSRKLKEQKLIQDLGETVDIDENHYANTLPMTAEEYAKEAKIWIDEGAYVVGGCCTTRPEHIRKIADELKK
jgi:S-methylmethionine-dependent homocysteine/selenocysteine methylase